MPRIMIVDDEPTVVELIKTILEKEGYSVTSAESGDECLEKLKTGSVDLILMDFFMPGTDGRMVIETIRKNPDLKDTKIAVLTCAMFRKKGIELLTELNVLEYITKPIEIDDFVSRIKKILGKNDLTKLSKNFKKNEAVGLLVPDIRYDEILMEFIYDISKNYDKILYISINKPHEFFINKFRENNVNLNKFHFIDCITKTTKDAESDENCTYVSSPKAIDEIQTQILDILREREIDVVIFDSPSYLLMYYEHMDVLRFMHMLTTKLIISECIGIFPFPKMSAGSLRRSIEMFTDRTINLDEL